MGAEGFADKGTVVLAISNLVAKVVGWVSSDTVGEDRGNEMSLESSLLSIGWFFL